MALNARNKGHAFERKFVKELRDNMLFPNAVTSRSESKRLDDKGVDVAYTDPFYFQLKAVEKLGNLHKVLSAMPNESNYNVVVHKRNNQGEIVALWKSDFLELIEMLLRNNII